MSLSIDSTAHLRELENRIERGFETFMDVGLALMEIRDNRLYRTAGFTTFEHYCLKKWGLKQSRAYQVMDAARVAQALGSESSTTVELSEPQNAAPAIPTIVNMPKNEAQARELARLREPELIREAWQEADAEHGGSVTAENIRSIVNRRLGKEDAHDSPIKSSEVTVGSVVQVIEGTATKSREERAFDMMRWLITNTPTLDPSDVAEIETHGKTAYAFSHDGDNLIRWVSHFIESLGMQARNAPRLVK